MSQVHKAHAATDIEVVRLGGRLGAEIRNIALSGQLSDTAIKELHDLLLKHKVLFFRGQDHLSDEEQERFARRLGDLVLHPTVGALQGTASILELDSSHGGGRADQWHTDVTFVDAYPKIAVLRGIVIPESGGDTIWSNTVTAYETLSEPLRDLADKLRAIHTNAYDYAAARPTASAEDRRVFEEIFSAQVYETEHPVVRVHPETGERSLLLGNFVQRFVGHNKADSQKLYDLFQSHITAPENTVRWRWKVGDVAIWDNRATQHIAVNDYGDQRRVVHRATIDGEIPVGVDGRKSETLTHYIKPKAVKAA